MRFFALALFVFVACKPSSKGQSIKGDLVQQAVTKELSDEAVTLKNQSGTFALAYLKREGSVQYIVIRLADQKVIIKEKVRGSVSWDGDMRIKEALIPGMVKKDSKPEDYSRIIDLNEYVIQAK